MSNLTDLMSRTNNENLKAAAFEYVKQNKNVRKTAESLGLSTSTIGGYTRDPRFIALVNKLYQDNFMEANEALSMLADKARASMADFIRVSPDDKQPIIDWEAAEEANALRGIKKLTQTEWRRVDDDTVRRTTTIEIFDPMDPLKFVGKDLGLAQETVNVTINVAIEHILNIVQEHVPHETYERMLVEIQSSERNRIEG